MPNSGVMVGYKDILAVLADGGRAFLYIGIIYSLVLRPQPYEKGLFVIRLKAV